MNQSGTTAPFNWISLRGLPPMIQLQLPFVVQSKQWQAPKPRRALSDAEWCAAESARLFSQVIDGFLRGPATLAAHTLEATPLTRDEAFVTLPMFRTGLQIGDERAIQTTQQKNKNLNQLGVPDEATASSRVNAGTNALPATREHVTRVSVEGMCEHSSDILVRVTYRRKKQKLQTQTDTAMSPSAKLDPSLICRVTPAAVLNFRVAFETPADWLFFPTLARGNGLSGLIRLSLPLAITTKAELRAKKCFQNRCMSPLPDRAHASRNPTAVFVQPTAKTVPQEPSAAVISYLEQRPIAEEVAIVKLLLQESPLWLSTELIAEALRRGGSVCQRDNVIQVTRLLTYTFQRGPYYAIRCRFGFDPRSVRPRTEGGSEPDPVTKLALQMQRFVLRIPAPTRKLVQDMESIGRAQLVETLRAMSDDLAVTALAEHRYFSKLLLAGTLTVYATLRDLQDLVGVMTILEAGKLQSFHPISGWYTESAHKKLARYFSEAYTRWVTDTVAPALASVAKVVEFDTTAVPVRQSDLAAEAGNETLESILVDLGEETSQHDSTQRSATRGFSVGEDSVLDDDANLFLSPHRTFRTSNNKLEGDEDFEDERDEAEEEMLFNEFLDANAEHQETRGRKRKESPPGGSALVRKKAKAAKNAAIRRQREEAADFGGDDVLRQDDGGGDRRDASGEDDDDEFQL